MSRWVWVTLWVALVSGLADGCSATLSSRGSAAPQTGRATHDAASFSTTRCSQSQIVVSVVGGGPAAGIQGVTLKIASTGGTCVLDDWVGVTGIARSGSASAQRTTSSPAMSRPPARVSRVIIGSTRAGYVLLVGSDLTRTGGCPDSYRTFVLTLPHHGGRVRTTETSHQAGELTMCGRFRASPVLTPADVIAKQR